MAFENVMNPSIGVKLLVEKLYWILETTAFGNGCCLMVARVDRDNVASVVVIMVSYTQGPW